MVLIAIEAGTLGVSHNLVVFDRYNLFIGDVPCQS
jgi:hypothetical protein